MPALTKEQVSIEQIEAAAYRLSRTEDGSLVLRALRAKFGFEDRTTAVQTADGSLDPQYTLHLEGQRVVVMQLAKWIEAGANPEQVRKTEIER